MPKGRTKQHLQAVEDYRSHLPSLQNSNPVPPFSFQLRITNKHQLLTLFFYSLLLVQVVTAETQKIQQGRKQQQLDYPSLALQSSAKESYQLPKAAAIRPMHTVSSSLKQEILDDDSYISKFEIELEQDPTILSDEEIFFHALTYPDTRFLMALLTHGADPNIKTQGITALTWAIEHDRVDQFERLLQFGAKVNEKNSQIVEGSSYTFPALHKAAKAGKIEFAALLLKAGANVNDIDGLGYPALSWAAAAGHLDIVELLLEHDANPDGFPPTVFIRTVQHNTPLQAAADHNQRDCANLLLQYGANSYIGHGLIRDSFNVPSKYAAIYCTSILKTETPFPEELIRRVASSNFHQHDVATKILSDFNGLSFEEQVFKAHHLLRLLISEAFIKQEDHHLSLIQHLIDALIDRGDSVALFLGLRLQVQRFEKSNVNIQAAFSFNYYLTKITEQCPFIIDETIIDFLLHPVEIDTSYSNPYYIEYMQCVLIAAINGNPNKIEYYQALMRYPGAYQGVEIPADFCQSQIAALQAKFGSSSTSSNRVYLMAGTASLGLLGLFAASRFCKAEVEANHASPKVKKQKKSKPKDLNIITNGFFSNWQYDEHAATLYLASATTPNIGLFSDLIGTSDIKTITLDVALIQRTLMEVMQTAVGTVKCEGNQLTLSTDQIAQLDVQHLSLAFRRTLFTQSTEYKRYEYTCEVRGLLSKINGCKEKLLSLNINDIEDAREKFIVLYDALEKIDSRHKLINNYKGKNETPLQSEINHLLKQLHSLTESLEANLAAIESLPAHDIATNLNQAKLFFALQQTQWEQLETIMQQQYNNLQRVQSIEETCHQLEKALNHQGTSPHTKDLQSKIREAISRRQGEVSRQKEIEAERKAYKKEQDKKNKSLQKPPKKQSVTTTTSPLIAASESAFYGKSQTIPALSSEQANNLIKLLTMLNDIRAKPALYYTKKCLLLKFFALANEAKLGHAVRIIRNGLMHEQMITPTELDTLLQQLLALPNLLALLQNNPIDTKAVTTLLNSLQSNSSLVQKFKTSQQDPPDFTSALQKLTIALAQISSVQLESDNPKHQRLTHIMLLATIGECIQSLYKYHRDKAKFLIPYLKSDPLLGNLFDCCQSLRVNLGHGLDLTMPKIQQQLITECIATINIANNAFTQLVALLPPEWHGVSVSPLSSSYSPFTHTM